MTLLEHPGNKTLKAELDSLPKREPMVEKLKVDKKGKAKVTELTTESVESVGISAPVSKGEGQTPFPEGG